MNAEHDHDEALFDSLADLADDLSPEADRVREDLWQQTRRVQRGRRWRRRGGQVVLAGLLYAVGFFTAHLLDTNTASTVAVPEPVASSEHVEVSEPTTEPPTPPWHQDIQAPLTDESVDPVRLERLSRSGRLQLRQRRLRRAGDLYLSQQSDVSAALRCYRTLLDLMPEDDRRAAAPEDTWLLVALKQDHRTRS